MQPSKIPVYNQDLELISFTHPARARKLLNKKKATIISYNPFAIKIKIKGGKMFVSHKESIINLNKVERIELKDNKVMFFMDSMTARTNWEFENEEDAKAAYEKLKKEIQTKDF